MVTRSEAAERPLSVFNEYFADRYFFGIRCPQRTTNLMKSPQLEITNRSYAKIIIEGRSQRSFGHFGRSREFPHAYGLAGVSRLAQFERLARAASG